MTDSNFTNAQEWFQELRGSLIDDIEKIENQKFIVTDWQHLEEGGGKMSKINGSIIEKGGVNISSVSGKFEKGMIGKIPGTENDSSYKATGISVVLHMHSPFIPSMHFNTRFLQTEQEWFGGGMDITPCFEYEDKKPTNDKIIATVHPSKPLSIT